MNYFMLKMIKKNHSFLFKKKKLTEVYSFYIKKTHNSTTKFLIPTRVNIDQVSLQFCIVD